MTAQPADVDAFGAFTFDPYDYATQEDPYPAYAWLRENAPLYENATDGFWALSRHADVVAAFRGEGTFSNKMGVTLDENAWGPNAHHMMSFLAMDPPDQTRLRSLVSQGFTPRRVKELEPRIHQLALSYLDAVLQSDSPDFIGDFAGKLPMDVISELMGVPAPDRDEVRRLADLLVHREDGRRDVPQAGMDAALTLVGYYTDLLTDRRRTPREDLTSALAVAEVAGDRLADHEIIAFLFLMIVAGNETTTKLLGNAVYWGARNPAQLERVLANSALVPNWVEETLRYDTSTQLLARYLLHDVELHGRLAPAGSKLVLLVGSANRDEAVFPHADQFDLDRDTSLLASFGGGRHYCLGANLARLEANIVLTALTERVGRIAVDEARAVRVHSVNVRGFKTLPVTLHAR
jgi:cytochrome P450